ncbi:MAG TPA: TonB-dependent receptor [Terracidiphilus sp.]|nr:TonB-dependent receptor [Terracidiphilus sp.]
MIRPLLFCAIRRVFFLLAATFLFAVALHGQELLPFSGVVHDPSGAVIPSAHVTATETATGVAHEGTADEAGVYRMELPAGTYRLRVTANGFQTLESNGVAVHAAVPTHDVVLQLAIQEETVEVTGTNDSMDVAATQVGGSVSQEKLIAMPVNGRGFTDLLGLQAGVIPQSSKQSNAVVMSGCTSAPPSGDLNPGDMSVSGQRETANGFLVNGSSVEEDFNNFASVLPNLDSIAEFQVLTSNFNAEYGNFSGGQILVHTKSGTNNLHGSAFEFFRNTNFDATNYLGRERAAYDRHQFGGTLGGKLKRDRLFYFGDYQGTRMTQGVETGHIAVPSAANRSGDLSDVAAQLTGKVSGDYLASLLSQRLGRTIKTGEPYYTQDCATSMDGCVFPGGVIPEMAWSAPAKTLLTYIPEPNVSGTSFSTSSENETLTDNKAAVRLDWTAPVGNVSVYYFNDGYSLDNPYPTAQGGANVPGFNAISEGRAQLINVGWTTTAGTTLVNDLHLSYLRNANKIGQPVGGVGPSLASQGFVEGVGTLGIVPLNPAVEGIENVSFNDFTIGVDVTGEQQTNNTYQMTESLSKAVGRHTFKVGADVHVDQVNIDSNSINNGAFVFQGSETGLDFADFLIGVASTYEQGDASRFYTRNKYAGIFAQDSWQLRTNLTLNYGVRWDMLPPWHEKYNQLQTFVLGQQSEVYPDAPEGIVFPGDRGIPNTLSPSRWSNFSPRLGVAYSPRWSNGWLEKIFGGAGESNIRAGYGMFYTAFEGLSAGIMSACPPYGYDYDSTVGHPLFDEPFVSASTGSTNGQPFPSPIPAFGASRSHPNTTVDWTKYSPITGDPAFYYRNDSPYTESYNFSIERALTPETVLSVGYVGAGAHHLLVLTPASPGNAERCLSVSDASQVMPGTNTCGPFSEGGVFTKADGTTVEARGPFGPEFDGITYQKTIGWSNYNALEVTLKHHARNLDILGSYTYGKSLDDSSSLSEEVNPIDPGLSKAISAFDVRHNFVVSYSAALPLERLLQSHKYIVTGWRLSGITRFSTGMPVTLYNNDDTSLLGSMPNGINNNGVDTPNYAGGNLKLNRDPRNGQSAFDTAQITMPAVGEMGSARRRFFYGPGLENFDMALEKRMTLGDTRSLVLRAESFNVFNHAQFFGPEAVNGNPDSSNFGKIVNADAPRQLQLAVKFIF